LYAHLRSWHEPKIGSLMHKLISELAGTGIHLHLRENYLCLDVQAVLKPLLPKNKDGHYPKQPQYVLFLKQFASLHKTLKQK